MEVATVTVQPHQAALVAEIFRQVDEQVMDPELRQRLARNGFRGGILGGRIPDSLHLLLMEASDRRRHPTAETQAFQDEQRFVQCRESKSYPASIWGSRQVAMVRDDGHLKVREAYDQATCVMNVFGRPCGDGAMVRVVPQVLHGPMRQRFVVEDNAFHMEAKRDERTYEDLAVEFAMRPGDVVMLTSHAAEDSIGRAFFESHGAQKVLLIRLAQTQVSGLFDFPSVTGS